MKYSFKLIKIPYKQNLGGLKGWGAGRFLLKKSQVNSILLPEKRPP